MIYIVLGFTLLVAIFLFPPLISASKAGLKSVSNSFDIRKQQLKSDYQFRLKELSRRFKAEDFTEEEYNQLREELDQETASSLESISTLKTTPRTTRGYMAFIFGLLLVLSIAVITYWSFGDPDLIKERRELTELLQRNPAALEDLKQQAIKKQTMESVKKLLLAARIKLDLQPHDPSVWMNFAEIQERLGRYQLAVDALRKTLELEPKNIDVKLYLAQVLTKLKTDVARKQSNALIQSVLRTDPENEKALLSQGFNAFTEGDYAVSISSWKKVIAKRKPGSEVIKLLERSIKTAELKLVEAAKLQNQNNNVDANENPTEGVKVVISFAKEIKDQLTGKETIFVFAKAATGSPMPLAVVRFPIGKVPESIILDDSKAMRPALKMSLFDDIYVSARISKTADAIAKEGDITVKSEKISAPFNGQVINIKFRKSN